MVRLPGFTPAHTSQQGVKTKGVKTMSTKLAGPKGFAKGLALTLALVMAGCATSPDTVVVEPEPENTPEVVEPEPKREPPVVQAPPAKPPVPAQPDSNQGAKPPAGTSEMVTVSVYSIDDQCNEFVSESIQVPSDKAIAEAVGKSMASVDYNAFKLAGYQVDVNGGTAVVDMQLAPGSERQFRSLSSCEQRALFGGIEETLRNNEGWGVNAVKFTNNGKEIIL